MSSQETSRAIAPLQATLLLAGGALVGSCLTHLLWSSSSSQQPSESSSSARRSSNKNNINNKTIPPNIRQEQLSRHELYFGPAGMERLRHTRICVVGLGGVGSHTVSALARSGVGYLRIIDFDQVSLSSLNRHAHATLEDVGTPKAVCLQQYCQRICSDESYLQVDARVQMYTAETAAELLGDDDTDESSWDLVIDAIDDVPTKAHLIHHGLRRKIRVVSCMGAGGKADFTRLCVSDLRSAAKDPLATKLKQILKREMNKHHGNTYDHSLYLDDIDALTVLYNSEKTVVKLADMTESQQAEGIHNFGAVDGMRIRVLPVLGTTPAIMGQALAAIAVTECGGQPIRQPVTGERLGKNVRNKYYQHLLNREIVIRKQLQPNRENSKSDDNPLGENIVAPTGKRVWVGPLQVDADDLDYVMQVWRSRCAVTGARLGTVFHLVRWDITQPSSIQNLVLMSLKALNKYDCPEDYCQSWKTLPDEIRQKIEARLRAVTNIDEF